MDEWEPTPVPRHTFLDGRVDAERLERQQTRIRYSVDSGVVLGEEPKEINGSSADGAASAFGEDQRGRNQPLVSVTAGGERLLGKKRAAPPVKSFNGKRKQEREEREAAKRARKASMAATAEEEALAGPPSPPGPSPEEQPSFISVLGNDSDRTARGATSQQSLIADTEGPAPWRTPGASPPLSLHEDIVAFVQWITPHPAERIARQQLVDCVRRVVKEVCGEEAQAVVFGSFESDLFLPQSDLDIVVLDAACTAPLHKLARALRAEGYGDRMQLITRARVPLIKFVCPRTSFAVDISFDVPNGPRNTAMVKELLEAFPIARPIVLLLKYFLAQRQLNEVYTGGLGSFALIITVVSFLQHHVAGKGPLESNGRGPPVDLGALLLDYLELYGSTFNYYMVGISVRGAGAYYRKMDRQWFDYNRPFLLSVEDPSDVDNDVTKSSYNILNVRYCFYHAFQMLLARPNGRLALLDAILSPDAIVSRQRMKIIEQFSHLLGNYVPQQPLIPLVATSPKGSAKEGKEKDKSRCDSASSKERGKGKKGKKGGKDAKRKEKGKYKGKGKDLTQEGGKGSAKKSRGGKSSKGSSRAARMAGLDNLSGHGSKDKGAWRSGPKKTISKKRSDTRKKTERVVSIKGSSNSKPWKSR